MILALETNYPHPHYTPNPCKSLPATQQWDRVLMANRSLTLVASKVSCTLSAPCKASVRGRRHDHPSAARSPLCQLVNCPEEREESPGMPSVSLSQPARSAASLCSSYSSKQENVCKNSQKQGAVARTTSTTTLASHAFCLSV